LPQKSPVCHKTTHFPSAKYRPFAESPTPCNPLKIGFGISAQKCTSFRLEKNPIFPLEDPIQPLGNKKKDSTSPTKQLTDQTLRNRASLPASDHLSKHVYLFIYIISDRLSICISIHYLTAKLSILCSSLGYAKATVFASFSATGTGKLIRLHCNSSFSAQSVKETVMALRSKPIEVNIYH
jgi:hypothetical protein